jgi:hypothetical protein
MVEYVRAQQVKDRPAEDVPEAPPPEDPNDPLG